MTFELGLMYCTNGLRGTGLLCVLARPQHSVNVALCVGGLCSLMPAALRMYSTLLPTPRSGVSLLCPAYLVSLLGQCSQQGCTNCDPRRVSKESLTCSQKLPLEEEDLILVCVDDVAFDVSGCGAACMRMGTAPACTV